MGRKTWVLEGSFPPISYLHLLFHSAALSLFLRVGLQSLHVSWGHGEAVGRVSVKPGC